MSKVCEPRKWIPKSGASFRLPWKLKMYDRRRGKILLSALFQPWQEPPIWRWENTATTKNWSPCWQMRLPWPSNTTTRWITPDAWPWRERCMKTMQLYATCPLLMEPQSTCLEICQSSRRISQRPISWRKRFAPNIPGLPLGLSTLGAQHMARASADSSLALEENPLIFLAKAASQSRRERKRTAKRASANEGAWGM